MRFSAIGYIFMFIMIWTLSSCSSTKFVPEGEYLLDKVHIKTDNSDFKSPDLQAYIRQHPNYKMFGLNKTQLQIYNLSGRDSSRWINRQIRKLGEPPVIYDSTLVYKSETELKKFFVNKGYVNAEVYPVVAKHNKKVDITYFVETNEPYRIRSFSSIIEDSTAYNALYGTDQPNRRLTGESNTSRVPLVKPGSLFDRNILEDERQRLTSLLRNRGYYAFTKESITYVADSSLLSHSVDLDLILHPQRIPMENDAYKEVPHSLYWIDKVKIIADYDPLKYMDLTAYVPSDSVQYDNYTIYYGEKGKTIRPKVLMENCFTTPGRLYMDKRVELTYAAFAGLKALDNINIRFAEKVENDTSKLDCYILTMPARKQSFSFSIDGTNSAGDLGFASSLGYQHRNIFKGSETFGIKLMGAYEAISENFSQNYIDLGVQTTLSFPKFMFPFLSTSFKRSLRASTEFTLSYNYQTRPEYSRILTSGGLHYVWQDRMRKFVRQQFNLLDINYVYLPRIDQEFLNNLPPNAALFSYTNQFIVGMAYSYSYSTFNPAVKRRDVHSFRFSAESAGNALYGLNSMLKSSKDNSGSYELFGIYYAQYLKGDVDYSKTVFIDKKNAFAWRAGFGLAAPYGNSLILPFEKRYYSGGANSVRGWSVRTLGPGAYQSIPGKTTFYEQSADIKLDLSMEYRSHLFWKLELAAYIDAGNIWTIRDYEGQEGGQFKFDSFYKQIAMSYGLGLRFDFDFFLLRIDTGMKAYDPAQRGDDRWAVLRPNLTNNFAWHFAVGYPF